MEYYHLEQSWEKEISVGNLQATYELIKKQVGINIVRFLNYFRDKPDDDPNAIFRVFDFLPFENEIDDIVSPFRNYQEECYYLICMRDLFEEEKCSPNQHKKNLRYLIKKYKHLEKKVAALMAQFSEEEAARMLEDAIPGIIDSLSTFTDLYDTYITNNEIAGFIKAYINASCDFLRQIYKLQSIAVFLLNPKQGRKYLSPDKLQKMQLYQKYASWAAHVFLVNEEKMEEAMPNLFSDILCYNFDRSKLTIVKEVKSNLQNYTLLELLAEAKDTIAEIRRIE